MARIPAVAYLADRILIPFPDPAALRAELCIAIEPGHGVTWRGSRAQLQDEGLVPSDDGFWPPRGEVRVWRVGRWSFLLCRCRPAGFKGPMRLWLEGDYWMCRRR